MKTAETKHPEDAEDFSYIVEKKKEKKRKIPKKELIENVANPVKPITEEENIEFILMDFKNFEELNKFKNIKSLTLIQQGIKSIDVKI
jgi:hypothetical protein